MTIYNKKIKELKKKKRDLLYDFCQYDNPTRNSIAELNDYLNNINCLIQSLNAASTMYGDKS